MNNIIVKYENNKIIVLHDITIDANNIYGYDNNNVFHTINYNRIHTGKITIL